MNQVLGLVQSRTRKASWGLLPSLLCHSTLCLVSLYGPRRPAGRLTNRCLSLSKENRESQTRWPELCQSPWIKTGPLFALLAKSCAQRPCSPLGCLVPACPPAPCLVDVTARRVCGRWPQSPALVSV